MAKRMQILQKKNKGVINKTHNNGNNRFERTSVEGVGLYSH